MSEDKYLKISGISPSAWGKSGWIFLDSIALVYNPNKKKDHRESYKKFFMTLPDVLPCDDCGENLKKEIPNLEQALVDNKSLLKWLLKIRNTINKENGKPKITMKDAIFEIFNNNSSHTNQYIWIFIMVLALVLLICILRYFTNKKTQASKIEI